MSLILYNFRTFFVIFLIAFLIKLMDDYIDSDSILFNDIINNMGKGILPYCLLIFAISAVIDLNLTMSFFISSYIIGMFYDLNRKLSFRLKGYQESILLVIFSIFFLDYNVFIPSFFIILIIQLLDDLIDYKYDKYISKNNIAIKCGKVEVIIFIVILSIILAIISPIQYVYSIIIFSIFQLIENYYKRGK